MPLTSKELAEIIYEYCSKEGNMTGGNCHVVLDDNNLEDHSVEYCRDLCIKNNDEKGRYLMEQFLLVRKTARAKSIKTANKLDRERNGY